MSAELLLREFHRVTEELGAVARLRDFTWKLAVGGSLLHIDRQRWSDCTLADLGGWGSGGTPNKSHPEFYEGGIPWLVIGDLNDGLVSSAASTISDLGLANSSAKVVEPGAVLVAMYGSIGKLGLAGIRCATNQAIAHCVVNPVLVTPPYLMVALRSMRRELLARGQGGTQANISQTILKAWPICLPPLAEQHCIVAKVDELMALCDELEAARTEREARRDRLRTTSLRDLIAPEEPKENARFFLRHSARMTTRPEHVAGLRQTILDLAVRGRLVPQDGQRSQPTSDGAPRSDRLDLQLPNGWTWVRLSEVADARLGKMLDKARNAGRPYSYLRNTNVHWFDVRTDDLKSVPLEEADATKYLLQYGDVLICEGGHGIGRTAVWRSELPEVAFQKALHRVRPGPKLTSDFFAYCVFVYERAGILARYFTGVGIPHFTGKALAALVFPLPPLPEQQRIVDRVNELMAVCDELEQSLAAEQTERGRLLEALLHDALEDALSARELEPLGAR